MNCQLQTEAMSVVVFIYSYRDFCSKNNFCTLPNNITADADLFILLLPYLKSFLKIRVNKNPMSQKYRYDFLKK